MTPVSADPNLSPHEKSPAHVEKPEEPRRRMSELAMSTIALTVADGLESRRMAASLLTRARGEEEEEEQQQRGDG